MNKAILLKTLVEDDWMMKVYFVDPPIYKDFPRRISFVDIKSLTCLLGFIFTPSEGGQVIQMVLLDQRFNTIQNLSFEPILEKLREIEFSYESQDVSPILKLLGYETISDNNL
jgi:hypothetical protein